MLITGATGFLGRTLCPYLVEHGHQIRALVRPTSNHAYLKALGIERAWGDVRDPQAIAQALRGCRAVVHAAAKFRFWGKRADFFATNVDGTRNLLEAARQAGIERFIHISSFAVVGQPPPGELITEETPCIPQDAYQESKLKAEQLALHYCQAYGLPVIILRPGAFYGPGGQYGFNRLFFKDPLDKLPLQVHKGRHIIPPAYLRDVAQAVQLALTHGQPGEIYNICGSYMTHREIDKTVDQVVGHPIRRFNTPAWGMVTLAKIWTWLSHLTRREPYYPIGLYPYIFYDWRLSFDKAQRELGFKPTSMVEGIRTTLEWYQKEGILTPFHAGEQINRTSKQPG